MSGMSGPACKMQSYAEAKALKMLESNRQQVVDFNTFLLSRIYPFGGRVDSSNMNPIPYWSGGCQAVCCNFQTGDVGMSLNHGKFRENNRMGYVLKHPSQRHTGASSSSCLLRVRVLSCQRLPPKTHYKSSNILDAYVRLELHGTGNDSMEVRTKTIKDNGFNPSFGHEGDGEVFEFEVQDRESAMLRVVVMDDDTGKDAQIGQNSLTLTCIREGYRHVSLFDQDDNLIKQAGCLCRFEFEYLRQDA